MLSITCLHCGPIRIEDAAEARYVTGIVAALAVGQAPLGAITCPLCRDEVRASAVRQDEPRRPVEPWLCERETR